MFRHPVSVQRRHLGWEVKFNGKRVGLGHTWVPEGFMQLRRPQPGVHLDVYGIPDEGLKNDFPCGGKCGVGGLF